MHRIELKFVDQDQVWRQGLRNICASENLSDVTFALSDGKVFGHKLILQEIIGKTLKADFCLNCENEDIVIIMPDSEVEDMEEALNEAYINNDISILENLLQCKEELENQGSKNRKGAKRAKRAKWREVKAANIFSQEQKKRIEQINSSIKPKIKSVKNNKSKESDKDEMLQRRRRRNRRVEKKEQKLSNKAITEVDKKSLNKELLKLKNTLAEIDVTIGPSVDKPTEKVLETSKIEIELLSSTQSGPKDKASEIEIQLGPGISVTKTQIVNENTNEPVHESRNEKMNESVNETLTETVHVDGEAPIVIDGSEYRYDDVKEIASEKSLIDSILDDDDTSYYSENCSIIPVMTGKIQKKSKKFSCDLCSFKATKRNGIQRHKEYKHDGKYKCEECGHKAYNTTHLKEHKLVKHQGVTFPCDSCDFTAKQTSYLKKHKLTKH